MTAVKASMKECQNTLRAASQDGFVKSDYLLGTVKEMATGLGYGSQPTVFPPSVPNQQKTRADHVSATYFRLECYEEITNKPTVSPLPVSTLTIGGTVIVIDVGIHTLARRHISSWMRTKCPTSWELYSIALSSLFAMDLTRLRSRARVRC